MGQKLHFPSFDAFFVAGRYQISSQESSENFNKVSVFFVHPIFQCRFSFAGLLDFMLACAACSRINLIRGEDFASDMFLCVWNVFICFREVSLVSILLFFCRL